MIRRLWRSLVVRWLRWRADVNRRAAGRVSRDAVRRAVSEQRHEERKLATPEPPEQARGGRSLWREVDL